MILPFFFQAQNDSTKGLNITPEAGGVNDVPLLQLPSCQDQRIKRASRIHAPHIQIDPALLSEIQQDRERCTIVWCMCVNLTNADMRMRVWPETCLVQENGIRKKLIQAYGISLYPDWQIIKPGAIGFTLVFEGLDKDCLKFDLVEDIPESGGFNVTGVERNERDVYFVRIH